MTMRISARRSSAAVTLTLAITGACVGSFAACKTVAVSSTTASDDRADWPSYNKTLDGQRYSELAQITPSNVARLKPVCELGLGEEGGFQTGPVVIGDTMFLTTAHTTVAMNAVTCALVWRKIDPAHEDDPFPINRGVAYLNGRVYRGMPGGRLAALDSRTGGEIWSVNVANGAVGEFLSSAPIAWDGMVYIGLAGGDWGIRGAMFGFDAATGAQKWKFYTIPVGTERGAETWKRPATALRGGGAMWTSYTLDPRTGELFVPVGNPAPDLDPDARPGDNLFTNSVVVLDAKSGALKWWYQAVPNDGFDWDMSAAPALYRTANGAERVAIAGKDGILHGVDRTTHSAVFKQPITTILNADKKPTPTGVRACPGVLGGAEWNGPAVDPTTGTLYVGSVDWCATFTSGKYEYVQGQLYMGTGFTPDKAESATGWVHAINGVDGSIRWKYKADRPIVAGIVPTAGGVLFTGDVDGRFYAFDKATGAVLLREQMGGSIAGGIVTYAVGGKQYVATTAGNVSRGTFDTKGSPRMIVMALDAPTSPRRDTLPEVNGRGLVAQQTPVEHGEQIFEQFCSACHGAKGEQGVVQSGKKTLSALVAFIKNPTGAMPKLHPDPLSDLEVDNVAAYVLTLQRR
jgi:alcohol dehydrogenase (cytochrome c)